jgi:hypothetical protein
MKRHKTRSVFERDNIVSECDLVDAAKKLNAFQPSEVRLKPDSTYEQVPTDANRDVSRRSSAAAKEDVSLFRKNWRRRPDLNRGWRFCRQGRDVYLVDSSCFLVGPAPSFSPVFGRKCSQVVPNCDRRQSVADRVLDAPKPSRRCSPALPPDLEYSPPARSL